MTDGNETTDARGPRAAAGSTVRYAGLIALVMLAAATATANLTLLLPTSPEYHAAWWKVAAALTLAVVFASAARKCAR